MPVGSPTFPFSPRTYPQLVRIVRALCAVVGRCCLLLVAAVAVTVAVSRDQESGWPMACAASLTGRSGTQQARRLLSRMTVGSSAPWSSSPPATYGARLPKASRPEPCRGWPASGPGRLRPGPWFLSGVSVEAPGSSATSRVRWPGSFQLRWLSCGHSRTWGWKGGHVHSAGHPRI